MPIPKSDPVRIKILSTKGCVNTPRATLRIEEVSKDLNIPITIEKILISTQEEADTHKFMGSPTILVNGADLDPIMRDNKTFGFT